MEFYHHKPKTQIGFCGGQESEVDSPAPTPLAFQLLASYVPVAAPAIAAAAAAGTAAAAAAGTSAAVAAGTSAGNTGVCLHE